MLWSLLKILVFVAVVAAISWGAGWLLEYDGAGLRVTFNGQEFTFTALQAVMALAALLVVLWLLLKVASFLVALLRFVNGDETALSRYFDRNRERKGVRALSEGLMALASGEGKLAMAKAAKAERYLQKPELTNLLTAQAAEMAGDRAKAEAVYKKLVTDESTRFVGVRGIMKQRLADGDTDTALKLAERAFAIKPRHEETQDILLKLQAEKADWAGARKTLNAKLKHGSLPRDVHRRRDAVLALSEARDIADAASSIEKREAAIEANRLSPELIPAAVMAARSYIEQGKPKYALRVLKRRGRPSRIPIWPRHLPPLPRMKPRQSGSSGSNTCSNWLRTTAKPSCCRLNCISRMRISRRHVVHWGIWPKTIPMRGF